MRDSVMCAFVTGAFMIAFLDDIALGKWVRAGFDFVLMTVAGIGVYLNEYKAETTE